MAGLNNEILSTLWQMERDGLIQPAITGKGRLHLLGLSLLGLEASCDKLASDPLAPSSAGNMGADLAPAGLALADLALNAERTAGANPLESAPPFTGTTITDLEQKAEEAVGKRGGLDRLYVPCPPEETAGLTRARRHETI